jgi:ferritin-like metal-binding protein YciE
MASMRPLRRSGRYRLSAAAGRAVAGRRSTLRNREKAGCDLSPGLRPRVRRVPVPIHSPRGKHMAVKTIEELFIHELSDIYSAEKQLAKALPRLARACEAEELRAAFETHLEETNGQIERIDQVVELLGIKLKRIKCAAMEGLIEEGKEVIDSIEAGALRDAALIGGAQKVEHYEIASYGTLCALAKQLGYKDAITLLKETLEEEKATDEKLTMLAEGGGNERAAQEAA